MRTRQLGNTDLNLTTVGLGTWAIGGPWQYGWGPQDDGEAVAAILAALEEGINWLDTAPIYGCGHSEELVGKALAQTSEKPIVATKCSLLWNEKREKISCLKKESIRAECHDSLKRLGVEAIDLYQMHWPEPQEDLEEAWGEMAKLLQEGKVRYIGVSNFTVEQIKIAQQVAPVHSLQPYYNMLHRVPEDELLEYCGENNIGVVAYSPMGRGLLTGKFSKERVAALAPDDNRQVNPDFHEPNFSINLNFVEQLKPIAQQYDITLAQLSIAWVLRRPEVTSAIVGARRPSQILETAVSGDITLNGETIEQIEKLLTIRQEKINGK